MKTLCQRDTCTPMLIATLFAITKMWEQPKCPSMAIWVCLCVVCVCVCVYTCFICGGSDGKESACNAGDLGLIPGLGRSPGEGDGYLLQYFFFFSVLQLHFIAPVFLPGEFQGQRSLVGYRELQRVRYNWVTNTVIHWKRRKFCHLGQHEWTLRALC